MRKITVCIALLMSFALALPAPAPSAAGQQKNKNKNKNNNNQPNNNNNVVREETTPQDYAALVQLKELIGKIYAIDTKDIPIPMDAKDLKDSKDAKDTKSSKDAKDSKSSQNSKDAKNGKDAKDAKDSTDAKSGTMTLTYEYSHMALNPNPPNAGGKQNQQIQQLQQKMVKDYNAALTAKNATQKQQALARYQSDLQQLQLLAGANAQNMFQLVKASKDFDLVVMEKVKVCRTKLPEKYNDEGELHKYTNEELKKLRSPDIQGAYIASLDDLKPGLNVRVYVVPPKKQAPKKTETDKKSDADTKKSDSATTSGIEAKQSTDPKKATDPQDKQTTDPKSQPQPDIGPPPRPQVRMILIIDDPTPPAQEVSFVLMKDED